VPQGFRIVLANCLTHGRRNFIDAMAAFPKKRQHVIKAPAEVYHHDEICKQQCMMHQKRLSYYQAQSGPVMKEFEAWSQAL
jgi:hypothetical protein